MYMFVHICVFMYMYISCTYMFTIECKLVNMYIHVCTMFRHVCTDLPILVQVVRIPDAGVARRSDWPGPAAGGALVTLPVLLRAGHSCVVADCVGIQSVHPVRPRTRN